MTHLSDSVHQGLLLRGIEKSFGEKVLSDVNLDVAPGEIVALTGPSGAGKTTLCRIIAGLQQPDAGAVELGGTAITDIAASQRRVALMFESYALYPHFTVEQNVMSPLLAPNGSRGTGRPLSEKDMRDRAAQVLDLLEIGHLGARLPGALSGGQKQRVALARTLVCEPTMFLLDEPISHLDAKLRHKLRGEIRQRLRRQAAPTIWATPDGLEALSVGDRVAVINAGCIEQIGTPEELWQQPATTRVATLLGDPPMNLIPGTAVSDGGNCFVERQGTRIELPQRQHQAARSVTSGQITVGIRPNDLSLCELTGPGAVAAEVYSSELFGKYAIVTVNLKGVRLKLKTALEVGIHAAKDIGKSIGVAIPQRGLTLFDGISGRVLPEN